MKRKWFACVLTALLLLVSLPLAALAAPASFDPGAFGHSLRSEHFTVYYNISGNGAIAPEQGQAVADAMELAYRRLITEGGLRPLRMLPEPVVAGVDRRELGGTNTSEAMAYRPRCSSPWTSGRGCALPSPPDADRVPRRCSSSPARCPSSYRAEAMLCMTITTRLRIIAAAVSRAMAFFMGNHPRSHSSRG